MMRVALVHDFFVAEGGAEQVALELARLLPTADVHTSFFDAQRYGDRLDPARVRTWPLQRLLGPTERFRSLLPLYPAWFGPPQPDWPANVQCAGFPLFDDASSHPNEAGLESWLAQGEPPVVFTAGSANVQVADFARVSIDAAGRIGRRALVVARAGEAMPSPMPAHARHASYVPFSRILPRAAALVSHAGIGTCAQACAAGIPHLGMPISFDQFDNASRLVDLGIGTVLPAAKYSARRASRALSSLLSDAALCARARDISTLVRSDDGPARAATLIEGAITQKRTAPGSSSAGGGEEAR